MSHDPSARIPVTSSLITVQRDSVHVHKTAEGALFTTRALQASSPNEGGLDSTSAKSRTGVKMNRSPASSPPTPHRDSVSPHRFRRPAPEGRFSGQVARRSATGPRIRGETLTSGPGSMPQMIQPSANYSPRTIGRSPLSTPVGSPSGASDGSEYFGLGIAVTKDTQRLSGETRYVNRRGNLAPQTQLGSPDRSSRVRTTREQRERDKKVMLSKALDKANTAVVLDNEQNFPAALEAYSDACALLALVAERTAVPEDSAKLDAIRMTYVNRMEELTAMQSLAGDESGEKELPHRPDSSDSVPQLGAFRPISPISPVQPPEGQESNKPKETATQDIHSGSTRDSFLTTAIREVEAGSSSSFLGPLWERSKSPLPGELDRSDHQVRGPDAPAPLRTPSPQPPPKATDESGEPVSWLNTIDESDSDSASVHSGKRSSDVRRRDLSGTAKKQPTPFDTAFDEAVEAAYEDGYQPDHGDHDQHIADDIAKDYLDQEFHYNHKPQSLSSLPRDSVTTLRTASIAPSVATITASSAHRTVDEDDALLPSTCYDPQDKHRRPTTASGKAPSIATSIDQIRAGGHDSAVTPWETDDMFKERTPSLAPIITPSIAGGALKERRNPLSTGSLTIETGLNKRTPSASSRQTNGSLQTPSETSEASPWETRSGPSSALRKQDSSVPSSAISESGSSVPGDLSSPKLRAVRAQKSLLSLDERGEPPLTTPTSSTAFSVSSSKSRNDGQKLHTMTSSSSLPPLPSESGPQGGFHLFDTTLGRSTDQGASSSPRTPRDATLPPVFEPCPDSSLLRPFWLLRSISNTIISQRGAYITTRLFMPHEAWLNRTVKLKNVEDKISACQTLTTALMPLQKVDQYDADAVLEQLQKFEEIMERVQATLAKKLGSEVGVSSSMFKDSDKVTADSTGDAQSRDSKFSWKKLRRGQSGSGTATVISPLNRGSGENANMATVPMTSFMGVERRGPKRAEMLQQAVFEGPHKSYMEAVARLGLAAQVIDEIARQVEDPGLKHSSTTHVGLELSTRHAAEFFGFFICRFLLADVGLLIDKYVKRSTEWVLA